MSGPKYQNARVSVDLNGPGDNAFTILCRMRSALLDAGVSRAEIADFFTDALSADYGHLLAT